jgi:hypothetical protein
MGLSQEAFRIQHSPNQKRTRQPVDALTAPQRDRAREILVHRIVRRGNWGFLSIHQNGGDC